jgi:16S rRNA processing protein RimM
VDLSLGNEDYLDEDIIGLDVLLDTGEKGTVLGITNNGGNNKTLELLINGKKVYVPYHKDFIKKIDLDKKIMELTTIEGLI